MDRTGPRHLSVELPSGPALRWTGKLVRLTWMPFGVAIGGRWLASGFEVLASSLLALAVVQLGGSDDRGLPIPGTLMTWIEESTSPLVVALLLALGIVLAGRLIETLVEWCLTWTHLKVNNRLTPEVMEASVEPATQRLLDPATAVQRWLLKLDISYLIYESLAATIGHVGTVVIILFATFKANATAGQVALGGLVLWAAASIPLMVKALRASRRAAQSHEAVGRIIRDSAALRAELGRPSLRAYWRQKNLQPMAELHATIKWEGIWNAALFGVLGLISRGLPIVAVLAASATGSVGSALAVLLYLTRMAAPLGSLASTLPWVQRNLISVQRTFQVIESDRDRIEEVPEPFEPRDVHVCDWVVSLPDGSRISYPEHSLRRGEILCVVGPSGSGKSSLLDSLAGHLQASGSLLVDGAVVAASNPKWRETCAFVRQEPELVPGGLLDNLHGFPGWRETPALAQAVAAVAASRLRGTGGEVSLDDKGVSVGQRRALSVLRALGSDAPVLLLDEPIAGVDDALVSPIRAALLEAAAGGRLVLVTAHHHDVERLDLDGCTRRLRLSPTQAGTTVQSSGVAAAQASPLGHDASAEAPGHSPLQQAEGSSS
jgi:ABC-type multidrug transport system fused ATPase/permease subunit